MTDQNRRDFLQKAVVLSGATLLAGYVGAEEKQEKPRVAADDAPLTRITFGSCAHQDQPQPIWDAVLAAKPELFVFLGDNVYADTPDDPDFIKAQYDKLAAIPGFRKLRKTTPVVATWDDHDFGEDDAGGDYPLKEQSRQIFLDFWDEPKDSPRRQRDGVYTSYTYGPPGRRVQVILLDLRYNRTPLTLSPILLEGDPDSPEVRQRLMPRYLKAVEKIVGSGRELPGAYTPMAGPRATMLGEKQWRWLEARLREPADLRLIGSSLQVLAEFTGDEGWPNFPHDRARLFQLIRDTKANGVVFLSGDMHYGELSGLDVNVPYPLYDLTSSGLNQVQEVSAPNGQRLSEAYCEANFGWIEIDWEQRSLTLGLRDIEGKPLLDKALKLAELTPVGAT
jgi:alkaline phosphatase D